MDKVKDVVLPISKVNDLLNKVSEINGNLDLLSDKLSFISKDVPVLASGKDDSDIDTPVASPMIQHLDSLHSELDSLISKIVNINERLDI